MSRAFTWAACSLCTRRTAFAATLTAPVTIAGRRCAPQAAGDATAFGMCTVCILCTPVVHCYQLSGEYSVTLLQWSWKRVKRRD